MTISTTAFLALADSLGAQYDNLTSIPSDTHATNVATGATNNLGRIQAYTDADLQVALLAAANTESKDALTPYVAPSSLFSAMIRALNSTTVTGGVDAYLTSNAIQVGPHFAALYQLVMGQALTTSNVDSGRAEAL